MRNGKVNLGLDGPRTGDGWYPFLNIWKMSDEIQINTTGTSKFTSRPPNTAGSAWLDSTTGQSYVDANGELANPLPADATSMIRIYESHATGILTEYSRAGEAWVLKFDGTAATVSSGLENVVRVGNRITGTWATGAANKQLNFSAFDDNDPPRNIRFCPAAWEARLDAGEIFNPDWLAEVRRGSGIIRFMDWMVTNKNRSTRTFANIPTEDFYIWAGANGSDDSATGGSAYLQGGMPLSIMTRLAEEAESHAWVCIPHVFGTPKTARVTGVTQANPPVVTSANHPFVNGDQVIVYQIGGMTQATTVTLTIASPCVVTWTGHPLQANNAIVITGGTLPTGLTIGNAVYVKDVLSVDTFTVSATPGGAAINTSGSQSGTHTATTALSRNTFTVAGATTDTFELAGVNTTSFSAFSSSGWLTSPYSLSGMTTQMTLFATHFRDNMPTDFVTYYEFSNEAWNSFITDAFHWLSAQSRLKFANDNSYKMTGYLLAHCMKTVRDVYGVNNRTKWKGVLATFSLGTTVTNDIISGVNTYISEHAPSLTINDLVDDLAVVGYWGGNLEEEYTAISQAWMDDSLTRFNASLEPTKYTYYDRMINEDLYDGQHTGTIFSIVNSQEILWEPNKAVADANGLGFVQYEAGNSNALADGGFSNDAQRREYFPEGVHTAADAANYSTMYNAFSVIGGTYPAKFTEANPNTINGSFGALRYPGDSNPVWDAVVAFNGGEESGSETVQEPVVQDGVGGAVKRKRKKKLLPGIQSSPAFPVHLYRALLPEVPEEEPEIQEPPPKPAVALRPLPPLSSLGESMAVPADIQIRLLKDAARIRDDEDALSAILSAL